MRFTLFRGRKNRRLKSWILYRDLHFRCCRINKFFLFEKSVSLVVVLVVVFGGVGGVCVAVVVGGGRGEGKRRRTKRARRKGGRGGGGGGGEKHLIHQLTPDRPPLAAFTGMF